MHPKPRKPGQRPDSRRREELLLLVDRAVAQGLRTPSEILTAVPELGSWDTASAYLDEARERWRQASDKDVLRVARGEMVAAIRTARERALAAMSLAEKPAEVARLVREVERLVRCEAWLLGLKPETLDRDEEEEDISAQLDELERMLGYTDDENRENPSSARMEVPNPTNGGVEPGVPAS